MLQLDKLGKIAVESTIDNVYVKIPEKEMSVSSILSSIAERTTADSMVGDNLILLDSKWFPVSGDKGQLSG